MAKINFNFVLKDKRRFFDRAHAESVLSKGEKNFLASSGAYIRKVAIRSLKRVGKKGQPSRPGTPPKHRMPGDSEALRRIEFRLNEDNKSVDIGPVHLPRTRTNPTTPQLHEFGGTIGKFEWRLSPSNDTKWMFEPENAAKYAGLIRAIKRWKSYQSKANDKGRKFGKKKPKLASDFGLTVEKRQAAYPARPFMNPALRKGEPKIREILKQEMVKQMRRDKKFLEGK